MFLLTLSLCLSGFQSILIVTGDLSFVVHRALIRDWLSATGVLSVTMRDYPGPIPPEVYDVFDQIICESRCTPPPHGALVCVFGVNKYASRCPTCWQRQCVSCSYSAPA